MCKRFLKFPILRVSGFSCFIGLQLLLIRTNSNHSFNSKTRNVGDYASKDGGDVHIEKGGPEGAIVLFSLYTKDGSLAESLDKNGNVISESHIDQFLK